MGWTQVRQSKCMGITFPISLSYEHVDIKGRQRPLVQQFPMDLRGQNHGKLTTKKQKDISKVVKNRIRLHSSNVRDYHVLSSIGCSLEPETVGLGNESCNQVPPPQIKVSWGPSQIMLARNLGTCQTLLVKIYGPSRYQVWEAGLR